MKKSLFVSIVLLIFASASFAAFSNYSTWQQAAPGMYYTDTRVSGNIISAMYKYTTQLPGFNQSFGKYKTQDGKTISYVTLRVTVDCASKMVTVTDIKAYDDSNLLLASNNVPQAKPADPATISVCRMAGILK